MRYMNDSDISNARRRYADHPVLSEAVATLADLKDWTDSNSDGWAYWPKPARAASQLMELIDGNGTSDYMRAVLARPHEDVAADLARALRPIKALRTRVTAAPGSPGVHVLGRPPMPWFPITAEDRAELARKRATASEAARADSVSRLAAKLAPALDQWLSETLAHVSSDGPLLRMSAVRDGARKLAELAVSGW
jgi:hypothetical protein